MPEPVSRQTARDIVDGIVMDLRDRSGLGDAFDGIDEEIQTEVVDTWVEIVIAKSGGAA